MIMSSHVRVESLQFILAATDEQGFGVVGSRRFLDGVGVRIRILRVLGVGVRVRVGIFDPTPTPKVQFELIFNMLCLFIFTSLANLTFDLAWWC